MDSQCPGCLGQAVVTLRLPSAIVESPWRHKRVPFVNIASVHSRSIKRRQWKHKTDYYGVVFAHLATGRGINAKDPSGLDSDRWIPHSRCSENPARTKALAWFSRHLSAEFTDLNPAPRGPSLYKVKLHLSYTIFAEINIQMSVYILGRWEFYAAVSSFPSCYMKYKTGCYLQSIKHARRIYLLLCEYWYRARIAQHDYTWAKSNIGLGH